MFPRPTHRRSDCRKIPGECICGVVAHWLEYSIDKIKTSKWILAVVAREGKKEEFRKTFQGGSLGIELKIFPPKQVTKKDGSNVG